MLFCISLTKALGSVKVDMGKVTEKKRIPAMQECALDTYFSFK